MRWPRLRRRRRSQAAVTLPLQRWAEPAYPPVGIRLGFADGSEVELDHADPRVAALRATADRLVQED
jgi:hypothetical protein